MGPLHGVAGWFRHLQDRRRFRHYVFDQDSLLLEP